MWFLITENYLASFAPLDSSVLEVISQPVPKAEDIMRPADVVKEFQKQQEQQQTQETQKPHPSAEDPVVEDGTEGVCYIVFLLYT